MKNAISAILILMIAFLGYQLFNLYLQHYDLEKSAEKLNAQITSLNNENGNLNSDIEYFSNPENLEKELKSQSNYRKAGEQMIIVIPSSSNSNNQ